MTHTCPLQTPISLSICSLQLRKICKSLSENKQNFPLLLTLHFLCSTVWSPSFSSQLSLSMSLYLHLPVRSTIQDLMQIPDLLHIASSVRFICLFVFYESSWMNLHDLYIPPSSRLGISAILLLNVGVPLASDLSITFSPKLSRGDLFILMLPSVIILLNELKSMWGCLPLCFQTVPWAFLALEEISGRRQNFSRPSVTRTVFYQALKFSGHPML